jgi:N-methylhydantoinase B/oxoprolinase/acetone carboxylase alpha subunit
VCEGKRGRGDLLVNEVWSLLYGVCECASYVVSLYHLVVNILVMIPIGAFFIFSLSLKEKDLLRPCYPAHASHQTLFTPSELCTPRHGP